MYESRIKQLTFRGLIGSSGEFQGNCGQGNILPYEEKTEEILAYYIYYIYYI